MTDPTDPTQPLPDPEESPTQPLSEPQPRPAEAGARSGAFSRHRTTILAGAACLILGGVIGGVVGWAVTDNDQPSSTTTAQAQHKHHKAQSAEGHHGAVVGSITAMNGSAWTLQTRDGSSITVDVGDTTTYGTQKKPEALTDFAVGDRIAVLGERDGTTVTAKRVVKRAAPASSTPSAAPSTTSMPG